MKQPWRIRLRLSAEIEVYPPSSDGGVKSGVITFHTGKGSVVGEIVVKADETSLTATAKFVDNEGNATTPDTVPQWTVGDENVLTVTPAEDGLSATFEVGAPGVSSVVVTTTETGDGTGDPVEVVLTGLVTAVAGDTVTGSVDFSIG